MLLEKGAITQWHIDLLMSWHHSGFNVHVCEPITADDRDALEKLAHYIIRCQFSQERMTYLGNSGTVIYRLKDGHTTKSFSALDWLAMITGSSWFVGCPEAAAAAGKGATGDSRTGTFAGVR